MAYEFHYTPTGTGVISGKEVLEQTEDAINDLGNTAISGVQEALDKAEQALTNSENAVDDAQTALNTANNAEAVAIQAQNDVSNLSGTVTNIGNRVTTAEGNITNLQGRMTTAEGNITNLQGRMTTSEGNIGNLQTAVSTAQATANSAQQTATTARQQSYVFRYSSTALTPSSTNSNALLDNTDNLKVGDKVIDSSGVLFSITAIDSQNSTFTIGTALIDLAQDSDVVHKSGNETVGGEKTFNDLHIIGYGTQYKGSRNAYILPEFTAGYSGLAITTLSYAQTLKIGNFVLDANNKPSLDASKGYIQIATGESNGVNACTLESRNSTSSSLGTSANKWSKIYGTEYYYGSTNVEFSTKFVTTDTAQTISGIKTFNSNTYIYNSDTNATTPYLYLKNSKTTKGSTSEIGGQLLRFIDKNNNNLCDLESIVTSTGSCELRLKSNTLDSNNQNIQTGVTLISSTNGSKRFCPTSDNSVSCGYSTLKWSDVVTAKVNGLEPSSLSLPVFPSSSSSIDISSYITDMTGSVANTYTPPANGYITFVASGSQVQIFSDYGLQSKFSIQSGSTIRGYHPVLKNEPIKIYMLGTGIESFRFIPCQGNV